MTRVFPRRAALMVDPAAGMWFVPKRELLRPLAAVVETGRLKVAIALLCTEALLRELRAVRRAFTSAGVRGLLLKSSP